MNDFIDLPSWTGNWQGMSRLHDPITERPEDSASTLTIQSVDTAFVTDAPDLQMDYTWAYQGAPQNGALRLYGLSTTAARADWTDTWHTGGEPMPLSIEAGDKNTLSLIGSYAAPPGPDWGWRIVFERGSETLQLRMENITPDGEALAAVEATYRRS